MNNLEQYTEEEISDFAKKYLENQETEKQNLTLKITSVNKEYKKHNAKAVRSAIINGTIILAVSTILMKSETNIADMGNTQILRMMDEVQTFGEDILSLISIGDFPVVLYTKLMGVLDYAIEQVGIVGIALASKSISFVMNSIGDSIKSRKMKKELNDLKELLHTKTNESEKLK